MHRIIKSELSTEIFNYIGITEKKQKQLQFSSKQFKEIEQQTETKILLCKYAFLAEKLMPVTKLLLQNL